MLVSLAAATVIALASGAMADGLEGPASVVDGDGLWVAGVEIRLHGIDAPEGHQTCRRNGGPYQCGDVATEALRDLADGRKVTCVAIDRDRYGRTVAKCYAEGLDLGAAMVESGWALAYRRYSEDYVTREDAARERLAGLWQGEFVPPWRWRRGERLQ